MPAPIRVPWFNRPGWSEYKAARGGGQKHWGYDSYCAPRSTIYAIGTGRVVARGYAAGGFGHFIDVFYPGLNVRQREAHMNEATHLKLGAQVTSSTALGRVGRTGNAKNIYWIRNGVELWHVHSQAWRGNTTNGDLNVDPRNYWGGTASGDITPITPAKRERRNTMTTLFYDLDTTNKGAVVDGRTVFALAGDSPGTAANWQETTGHAHATDLARVHGSAVPLSGGTFANRKAAYLSPVAVAGGAAGASIDYDKLAQALARAIPAATIDPAAIARAVNDDAAARLAQ